MKKLQNFSPNWASLMKSLIANPKKHAGAGELGHLEEDYGY